MCGKGPQAKSLCVLLPMPAESVDWVEIAKEGVQAAVSIGFDSIEDVRVLGWRRGLLESKVLCFEGLSEESIMDFD